MSKIKTIKNKILEKIAIVAIDLMSPEDVEPNKEMTLEQLDASDQYTDREKLIKHLAMLTVEDDIQKGFYGTKDRTETIIALYDLIKEHFSQNSEQENAQFTEDLIDILGYNVSNILYRHILVAATREELVKIQKAIEKKRPIILH